MNRRVVGLCVLVMATLAACGDDDVTPPPVVDLGTVDAGSLDAAIDAGGVDLAGCADADGDGHGAVSCGGDDCDDADASRYPGATERCDYPVNVDEDCNPTTYGTKDEDGDGYTDVRCCNGTTCGDDCDDTRGGTHPGVPEVCNRRDDDCNGLVDDDGVQVEGYADADRDLYGAGPLIMACAGSGLSAAAGDCNDVPPVGGSQSPVLEEVLGDVLDNDCDGTVNEAGGSAATWYLDGDGDGFGVASSTMTSTTVLAGYALVAGDCNDTNADVSPTAAEVCNGIDDDCNGVADFPIGNNDWEDDDGDRAVDVACGAAGTDCDDRDSRTNPGATEVCDGRDNDCDGTADEGVCGPGPYACLGAALPTTAPATIDITGSFITWGADGAPIPLGGVLVEAYGPAGGTALVSMTNNPVTGEFALTVPTGGVPFDGLVFATKTGYREAAFYGAAPTDADFSIPPWMLLPLGPIGIDTLTGEAQLPANGFIVVLVRDCNGEGVAGAVVTTTPASGAVHYNSAVAPHYPSATATMTDVDGIAFLFNVPTGTVTVHATAGGTTFRDRTVDVRADKFTGTAIAP